MSIITDDKIENIAEYCKAYYQNVLNIDVQKATIYFSDNIISDYNKFSHYKRNDFEHKINGTYIYPNQYSMEHVILINYQMYKTDVSSSIATILHELTHFADYNFFVAEYCNGEWKNINKHPLFKGMYYWSEYHARITEIIHMHIIMSMLIPSLPYDIDELKTEMEGCHLLRYNKELTNHLKDGTFLCRHIFDHCGRLYVYNSYCNHEHSIRELLDLYISKRIPNIEKLYTVLETMQTYKEASPNFSSLADIAEDAITFYESQICQ